MTGGLVMLAAFLGIAIGRVVGAFAVRCRRRNSSGVAALVLGERAVCFAVGDLQGVHRQLARRASRRFASFGERPS